MPDTPPFKLACIGTHGVGKTTLCYGVAARLKARDVPVEVVHEVARRCPLPINEQTTTASQSWILHTQVAEEILASARYPVVLCDRSALDNYVYLLLAAGPQPTLDALLGPWMKTYDLLVHVPIVDQPNPDGIRALDPAFQRAVDVRLDQELARRDLPVLRLDPDERRFWIDRVLAAVDEHIRPAQLELL
ncbi:MAG: AAA family ATPase [Acidobacteriota bacterium]|jgi:nicotinamide riboside kinase